MTPSEIEWLRQQGKDFLSNYEEIYARNAGHDESTWLKQHAERLSAVLDRLPVRQQEAVRGLLNGASTEEIAAQLGATPKAVASLIHRAMVTLRSDLSNDK